MGKPFNTEIAQLSATYAWAAQRAALTLQSFVARSIGSPLIAVGSGGSYTTAVFAEALHQRAGHLAKAITPYDLVHSGAAYRGASILILSAGGRNRDILAALRFAAELEPLQIGILSTTTESKLSRLAAGVSGVKFEGVDLPTGRDGFLATNSLFASAVLLSNVYSDMTGSPSLPTKLPPSASTLFGKASLEGVSTWTVLYGAWGRPTAWDLESKLTEAALGSAQVSDYRNFGHGRHHWFAKRQGTSGVVVVSTPEDAAVAERTCAVLPDIPTVKLVADQLGPLGSLQTLAAAMEFTAELGRVQGIDPGRPGVPEFGRKLYRMSPPRIGVYDGRPAGMTKAEAAAITRKARVKRVGALSMTALSHWRSAYRAVLRKLQSAPLGGIVFDYDGTLCSEVRRFEGVSGDVAQALRDLIEAGLLVGVATGRGRSVGNDLRSTLPEELWDSVVLGYYNGSEVALLHDSAAPDREADPDPRLIRFKTELEADPWLTSIATAEIRPRQVSVELRGAGYRSALREGLHGLLMEHGMTTLRIRESGHSFDVVTPGVSKCAVVRECESMLSSDQLSVLCIGDSGAWPGNDYELLTEPLSLSVDSVSTSATTCWNLTSPGARRVAGTLEYLRRLDVSGGKAHFK